MASVVVWSAPGTLLGALAFNADARRSWPVFVGTAVVGFAVSTGCVAVTKLALPAFPRYARERFRHPLNWVIVALGLVVAALVGTALGVACLVAIRWIDASRAVGLTLAALPTATYFTLLFGVTTSVMSESKGRVAAEARRVTAEARLASLESRVNPHFLFNTLNSIAALTHSNPSGAEQMINQLASLMRSSLDQTSPLVPLSEEVDMVRNYLAIERVRFGDRLRYTIDLDDNLSALVPRLSLQTLVENSVKYAVSTQRTGASISIVSVARDGLTRIEVEDDGPGFDPRTASDGHGLALLRARLSMSFGSAARLDVQSRPGCTRVSILIPTRALPTPEYR